MLQLMFSLQKFSVRTFTYTYVHARAHTRAHASVCMEKLVEGRRLSDIKKDKISYCF